MRYIREETPENTFQISFVCILPNRFNRVINREPKRIPYGYVCVGVRTISRLFATKRQVQQLLTLLEPQSRFGDNSLKFQVVCPQNGTAVLKGLTARTAQRMFRACGGRKMPPTHFRL